jgi:hypothetical protein
MAERHYGILGTVIVHSIILMILLLTYISLAPTQHSEGGILINFGDIESAGGLSEPAPGETQARPSPPETPNEKDGMLTQDFEEAPAVKTTSEKKKVTEPVKQPIQKTTKAVSAPAPKPFANPKADWRNVKGASSTEAGSSEGTSAGSGNMGDPSGTPESDNYAKGLGGSGMVANLNGRNPVYLQKPEFRIQKDGIVVVEITVNRSGKVVSATPGKQGSTITDATLYNAARKAALESKFNLKEDAPELQVGTITYHFRLQ